MKYRLVNREMHEFMEGSQKMIAYSKLQPTWRTLTHLHHNLPPHIEKGCLIAEVNMFHLVCIELALINLQGITCINTYYAKIKTFTIVEKLVQIIHSALLRVVTYIKTHILSHMVIFRKYMAQLCRLKQPHSSTCVSLVQYFEGMAYVQVYLYYSQFMILQPIHSWNVQAICEGAKTNSFNNIAHTGRINKLKARNRVLCTTPIRVNIIKNNIIKIIRVTNNIMCLFRI